MTHKEICEKYESSIRECLKEQNRRLGRLNDKLSKLEESHLGKEIEYNYWGGYSMGYLKGKIYQTEEIINILENLLDNV
jgi:hypothetical protein